jgi:hypothetical protein
MHWQRRPQSGFPLGICEKNLLAGSSKKIHLPHVDCRRRASVKDSVLILVLTELAQQKPAELKHGTDSRC